MPSDRLATLKALAAANAKVRAAATKALRKQRRDLLVAKTLPELKQLLRANEQITTGTKDKLIKRILDCLENGCLPRCPTCGLGRLKVAQYGNAYRCPGGYDDDEYMPCGFTASKSSIVRPPWQVSAPGSPI